MLPNLTETQWIFVILATLYAIEAAFWLPRGTACFLSTFNAFRQAWHSKPLFGNGLGGVAVSGPLPTDAAFMAQPLPISIGTAGVLGFVSASSVDAQRPSSTNHFATWEELARATAIDNRVIVSKQSLCKVRTSQDATRLAKKLAQLSQLGFRERESAVAEWLDSLFDLEATAERIELWRKSTNRLKWVSTSLFVWVFGVGLAYHFEVFPGAQSPWLLPIYLTVFFSTWWAVVLRLYFAHKKLFPQDRFGRFKRVVVALLSPASAMRSPDHLARDLFSFLHPATLAMAVLPDNVRQRYAAHVWRDIRYPQLPESPEIISKSAAIVGREYHRNIQSRLLHLWHKMGMTVSDLEMIPRPQEPDSVAYCPRCLREFTRTETTCAPCGELRPLPFDLRM